jgi:DNA-binding transcriptional MocR family regulator
MSVWIPEFQTAGPHYLAIADALEADVASGRIRAGTRLLPQRELAQKLRLSVGTVSKGYAEAERRGLISSEVGRGTYVLRQRPSLNGRQTRSVNLSLNVPPYTGEDEVLAETFTQVCAEPIFSDLLNYLPHQGLRDHRQAIATWFGLSKINVGTDRILITHGAQHAISLAAGLLARAGDAVVAEQLTYSGVISLANFAGYQLIGAPLDASGIVPDALDAVLEKSKARVVYLMPTLQTPTGAVMPEDRRKQVAEIIRKHDAYLIEDDAYGFLCKTPQSPISEFIPERSFYIASFAKCLSPGLRLGAMSVPDQFRDRAVNAIRATGWMAAPLMAEVLIRLIDNGKLAKQIELKRKHAKIRQSIALKVLGRYAGQKQQIPSFHFWINVPDGRSSSDVLSYAAQHGVTLGLPASLAETNARPLGLRICLGAATSEVDLENALSIVRDALESSDYISPV